MGDPLTISAAAGAGIGIVGGVVKGFGDQSALNAQKMAAQQNQKLALAQASDAVSRGEFQANQINLRTGQMVGQQRTGYAASGVDENSGTAAQVQATQRAFGANDAAMAEHNAMSEAWAHRVQANQYGNQASALDSESGLAEAGSVLGAAGGALGGLGSTFRARQDWLGRTGMTVPTDEE